MKPTFQQTAERLKKFEQGHLLQFWDELAPDAQDRLLRQIGEIDLAKIAALYGENRSVDWGALSRKAEAPPAVRLAERRGGERSRDSEARRRGVAALRSGEIGVLLTAGGQGSRLGFDHSKGLYPIGPLSRASLLRIHFEKAIAVGRRYGRAVPIYMMTSPVTHDEQSAFLAAHDRFGVRGEELTIFRQGTMPAVDASSGRILLTSKEEVFRSPDGHGGTVAALSASGAIDAMKRRGIKHLFYLQVDNPLAPICDPEFIGYHLLARSELTSMAIEKSSPRDKVGNFVSIDGKVHVIEYSDFPDDVAERRDADGALTFWAGSIAIHMFSVEFLDRCTGHGDSLPFHVAHKKVPYLDHEGRLVQPAEPNALKFERFIFDLLPMAKNPLVVEYEEREVFAPLKNAPGAAKDTAEYVQRFLMDQHRRWLRGAGTAIEESVAVEISPLWALDAEGVRERSDRPREIVEPTYLAAAPKQAAE